MAPILLPLAVHRLGTPAEVGLVIAASQLGGLLAPLWGGLADRYLLHRPLVVGGLLLFATGLAAFPLAASLYAWLGLALLQGIGVAGVVTVANIFVVEAHPRVEWDERIGWLQTAYGGGQMAGLLLAASVTYTGLEASLWLAAGLTASAAVWSGLTAPAPTTLRIPKPAVLHPMQHDEVGVGCPQQLYHHLNLELLRQTGDVLRTPFSRLLWLWLLSLTGTSAFFALYPIVMREMFGMPAGFSSSLLALAAGLRLVLYAPMGHWSTQIGPLRLLCIALAVRLFAFIGFLGFERMSIPGQRWLAIAAFFLIALPWAPLSVSSKGLTVRLSPLGEGQGIGFLNAISALAGVLGAILGGWCAAQWGYNAATVLATVGLSLGLLLALTLQPEPEQTDVAVQPDNI
jgi:MFS family permease